jgi:hypothetical protein
MRGLIGSVCVCAGVCAVAVLMAWAGYAGAQAEPKAALQPCEKLVEPWTPVCSGCEDSPPWEETCECHLAEGGTYCTPLPPRSECDKTLTPQATQETTIVRSIRVPCYRTFQCVPRDEGACDPVTNPCQASETGQSTEKGKMYQEQDAAECAPGTPPPGSDP